MAAVCGALPKEINTILNTHAQAYVKEGMSADKARIQAATDMLEQIEIQNTLGSTNASGQPVTDYVASFKEVVDTNNISTIYDRLASIQESNKTDSYGHSNYLRESIMGKLIIPLSEKLKGHIFVASESNTAVESVGSFDTANKVLRVRSAKNPILNSLSLSLQEIAAHEFVHAVTETAYRSGDYAIRKGINSLYEQAKAALKPSDFSMTINGVVSTAAENQERYDYIFNNPNGNGVLEFIAFGTTNEQFMGLLENIKLKNRAEDFSTFKGAVLALFHRLVDFVTNKMLHMKGDSAQTALRNLTNELAGLTNKNKQIITILSAGVEYVKGNTSRAMDIMIKPILKINNPTIKTAIVVVQNWRLFAKTMKFGEAVGNAVNNIVAHREYFFINLIRKLPQELLGMNKTNEAWHRLLRESKYAVEGARHKIKEATVTHVRQALGIMTDDDKRSLTMALLYTDIDDLGTYDTEFTFEDHRLLLADDKELARRIKKEEDYLKATFGIQGQGYINQANGLGMFMVRKESFNKDNQLQNAHIIAEGLFDPKFKQPTNWKEAIPTIQRLKTFHAIRYTTRHNKDAAIRFYDSQAKLEPENNGFNNLISLNKEFKRLSLEKLFNNDPRFTTAGYTKDLNAPDVTIKFSTKTQDKELLDKGFTVRDYPLLSGAANPNKTPMYIYVANYTGLVPFNKMTASLTSRQMAGTTLADVYIAGGMDNYAAHMQAAQDTNKIKNGIVASNVYTTKPNEKDVGTLFPVLDSKGVITGYRHIMKEDTRVKLLEKDTRIDNVLGAMFESITDKVQSIEINSKVAKEIINEHKTLYVKNPKGFITVTKDHPRFGEIYHLLPRELKAELDAHFGGDKIIVREAMMDIIFGYRKYSLFTSGDNSWLAKAMRTIVIDLLRVTPGKYYKVGRQTEQGLQEFIQELKSTIVLKTTVLGYNILSNYVVSFMHGMPIDYIAKKQGEAVLALEDYINNQRQVLILEQKLATVGISTNVKDSIKSKITQLTKEMENSPIKSLVDLGLLNSIVEDITIDDTDFGMKGKVFKYITGKTKWIPKQVKQAYEVGQISSKTGLFKLLEKTTRYSDFVARYAMHEWYLNQKGMSKTAEGRAEALQIVSETFVNYDLPTSKELQYLNDMGAYMFTKYAIRIQKTIYRLVRDNPKSVVGLVAIEGMFGNVTDSTDSWALLPDTPSNPANSVDEMVFPLFQLFIDIIK